MITYCILTYICIRLYTFYVVGLIRLSGGNHSSDGRVEIFVHTTSSSMSDSSSAGEWKPVCMTSAYRWRKMEADMVCRQMGYTGGATRWAAASP